MYIKRDLPIGEIARQMNVSHSTVIECLKGLGIHDKGSRKRVITKARSLLAMAIKNDKEVDPMVCKKCSHKMRIIAIMTDPGECTHSLEVNKILGYLKRNHAPPFDKIVTKISLSGFYSVSQDIMIAQEKVGSFYYPESAASSLIVPIFLTKYHSEVILGEKRRNVICEVEFIPQWGAFCVAGGMFM